jgi:hypothetical protein
MAHRDFIGVSNRYSLADAFCRDDSSSASACHRQATVVRRYIRFACSTLASVSHGSSVSPSQENQESQESQEHHENGQRAFPKFLHLRAGASPI